MRLLQQQNKNKIDYGKLKLKDEIDKVLWGKKQDNTQETQKLSFQQELKNKIDLLDKVTEGFKKQSVQTQNFLETLEGKVKEGLTNLNKFVNSLDARLAPLKEKTEERIKALQNITKSAETSITSLKEKETGTNFVLDNINTRIESLRSYSQKANEEGKELEQKIIVIERVKQETVAFF